MDVGTGIRNRRQIANSDVAVIGELGKVVVRAALPRWLPLDEIHAVVAPMLDPSQRSLRTVKD